MKLGSILSSKRKEHFYIMHLSYDGKERERLWNYAKDNRLIGLSHKQVNDDWIIVRQKAKKSMGKGWVRQFNTFCGMQKGDIVLVLNGMDSVLGVAIVVRSSHKYVEDLADLFFDHIRVVDWKIKYEYKARRGLPNLLEGFSNTLSRVPKSSPRWSILTNLDL